MKRDKKHSIKIILEFMVICLIIITLPSTTENILARMLVLFLTLINISIPLCFHIYHKYKSNPKTALKDKKIDTDIISIFCTSGIVTACLIVAFIIYAAIRKTSIPINIFELIAYFGVIIIVFLTNYFSTTSSTTKEKISKFSQAIQEFISYNFILNLLLFLLIIYFINSRDIIMGIVTAYMFYALERINSEYKNKTEGLPKTKRLDTLCLIAVNIETIFLLNEYIKIYDLIGQGNIIRLTSDNMLFILTLYLFLIITLLLFHFIIPHIVKNIKTNN